MRVEITYALRLAILESVKNVIEHLSTKAIQQTDPIQHMWNKQNALIVGVWKICTYYDTLNEALAAWPALRGLLPEKRAQADFPFDGTPKPLPNDIDVAEITAMIVRARLEV